MSFSKEMFYDGCYENKDSLVSIRISSDQKSFPNKRSLPQVRQAELVRT